TYDEREREEYFGAGFVYSEDGKIVTNYHILEDAYSATILLDGQKYEIESVLAYDAAMDLAIVKIDATDLPVAPICKKQLHDDQKVYAIGVALESNKRLVYTCTSGNITHADIMADNIVHIQHDVPITHGNSGGPLINEYGEVVGINAWRISGTTDLNFAVFTAELDNLTYGTPVTIAELNHKQIDEYDAYDRLADWLMENATETNTDEYAFINESEDGSAYGILYSTKDESFTVTFSDEDSKTNLTATLTFQKDEVLMACALTYQWKETTPFVCKADGQLNPKTYTSETKLTHSEYTGITVMEDTIGNLYNAAMTSNVAWLDIFLQAIQIPVTMKDLGFEIYS
ncbi:MAG: serine protease, partial [Clostridia bacterium]|nr:serine protease [Clostridia bacterium]